MKTTLIFLAAMISLAGAALADPVTWPVPPCGPASVATASPAPAVNDSASLSTLPFVTTVLPISAAVVVGLNKDGTASVRCVYVNERSRGLEGAAVVAVAGLKFATPRVANTAIEGGRYLVRISSYFGVSWVRPPPPQPLLPPCGYEGSDAVIAGDAVPKPVHREAPHYPAAAEGEGIEGDVRVRLDVFSSGAVSPSCIVEATAPGWFEAAAVEALNQWTFNPPSDVGPRRYEVTVRFRMEN